MSELRSSCCGSTTKAYCTSCGEKCNVYSFDVPKLLALCEKWEDQSQYALPDLSQVLWNCSKELRALIEKEGE